MAPRTKLKSRALTVRKLPEDHYNWLQARAAAHGRSMEAEMREIIAQTKRGAAEWPQVTKATPVRGFAEPAARGKPARAPKAKAKPVRKLSADKAIAKLQLLFAKATKGRKSKKLLSEEFMEERRRMWGEE